MTDWRVVEADVLDWAAGDEGEKFHAILCDPPYAYGFMGKKWDDQTAFQPKVWKALGKHLLPGAFVMAFAGARTYHRLACAMEDAGLRLHPCIGWIQGSGFPKATRIDTQVDKAAGRVGKSTIELKRRLRALMDASGKTRKQIDTECGFRATNYITLPGEDKRPDPWINVLPSQAKWEVMRDVIGCGEGLDPLFVEANREVTGQKTVSRVLDGSPYVAGRVASGHIDITAPATPLARTWQGHRYGLQALKPCLELIAVAQKPYEGRPVECITRTGAGSFWIDGARVGVDQYEPNFRGDRGLGRSAGGFYGEGAALGKRDEDKIEEYHQHHGRWPPNCAISHHWLCERREGERKVGSGETGLSGHGRRSTIGGNSVYQGGQGMPTISYGEESVPRYACALTCGEHAWVAEDKTRCPECGGAAEWLCAVRRLGEQSGGRPGFSAGGGGATGTFKTGKVLDHYQTYSDTGTAARFFPNPDWAYEVAERIAAEDPFRYCAKAGRKERDAGLEGEETTKKIYGGGIVSADHPGTANGGGERKAHNPHPTVKPISLCKWLATLLLPPPEYAPRRIVIPFGGTGSEGAGAGLAGWDEIVLIEMESDYCDIARARLTHWLDAPRQLRLEES